MDDMRGVGDVVLRWLDPWKEEFLDWACEELLDWPCEAITKC